MKSASSWLHACVLMALRASQRSARVRNRSALLQSKQQGQRVDWRSLEPVVFIKLFGPIMQGMNQQGPNARMLRHQRATVDSILQ